MCIRDSHAGGYLNFNCVKRVCIHRTVSTVITKWRQDNANNPSSCGTVCWSISILRLQLLHDKYAHYDITCSWPVIRPQFVIYRTYLLENTPPPPIFVHYSETKVGRGLISNMHLALIICPLKVWTTMALQSQTSPPIRSSLCTR